MIATTDGSPSHSKKPRKSDADDSSGNSFGYGDDCCDDGFNNPKLLGIPPNILPMSPLPQACSDQEQEQLREESTVPVSFREEREELHPSSSIEQTMRPLQELQDNKGSDKALRSSCSCNRSDLDNNIATFLTCTKCSMVFADTNKAQEHKNKCTITNNDDVTHIMQEGRVFYNKGGLLKHILVH